MLCKDITLCRPALDRNFAELEEASYIPESQSRLEVNEDGVSSALLLTFVNGAIEDAGPRRPLPQFINLFTSHSPHPEALCEHRAIPAVTVNHGIDLRIFLTEDGNMNRALPDEGLVRDLHHPQLSVLGNGNYIIETGTFLNSPLPLEPKPREAVLFIEVERFGGGYHLTPVNPLEFGLVSPRFQPLTIFALKLLVIPDRITSEILQVPGRFLDGVLESPDLFFRAKAVILRNALDPDFGEPGDVLRRDLPLEKLLEGPESLVPSKWSSEKRSNVQ